MKTKSDDYPLPEGWKRAISEKHNNKPYFINKLTKQTQWFDPRDVFWKKKTWAECSDDEIPYGWEISYDAICGRYFIDHLNKRNLLDDPRSQKPQEHYHATKEHIEETEQLIEKKKKLLQLKKEKLSGLPAKDLKRPELEAEIKELELDIEASKKNTKDMKNVIDTLEKDKEDQLIRQQKVQQDIDQFKKELEEQLDLKESLHKQLETLSKAFQKTKDWDHAHSQAEKVLTLKSSKIGKRPHSPEAEQKKEAQEKKEEKPVTRMERELELLMLKKELEYEKEQTERLKVIAQEAKKEIEKALAMPSNERLGFKPRWIQLLNEFASKSQTIRLNVKKKADDAVKSGQVMSFRDKLLFFTSSPLDLQNSQK